MLRPYGMARGAVIVACGLSLVRECIDGAGEAASGREAVDLRRRFGPDPVVMDVQIPEMERLAAPPEIKAALPALAVLVPTAYDNPDYMPEAIHAGAAGFVLTASSLSWGIRLSRAVVLRFKERPSLPGP